MNDINIDELVEVIAMKIQLMVPPKEILWCGKECARYLGVSPVHFMDRLSKGTSFPKPIKLPTETGKKAHSRWYASEVIAWVKKHRQAS